MKSISDAVKEFLFAGDGSGVFAVLDGASVPGLRVKLHQVQPEFECLYRGDLEPDMAEVAPYLVRLEHRSEMTSWILEQGWGKHWGIFALTQANLFTMRQHFRRFLIVHDSTGKALYFRFYDPRVLRTYLPTCNGQELAEFFGPVDCYMQEGEDAGVLLRFRQGGGALMAGKEVLKSEKK